MADKNPQPPAKSTEDAPVAADENPEAVAAPDALSAEVRRQVQEAVAQLKIEGRSEANRKQRLIQCKICNEMLAGGPWGMRRHYARKHSENEQRKKHECDFCYKLFTGPKMLAKHKETAHKAMHGAAAHLSPSSPSSEESSTDEDSGDSMQEGDSATDFYVPLKPGKKVPKAVRDLLDSQAVESDSDRPRRKRARRKKKHARRHQRRASSSSTLSNHSSDEHHPEPIKKAKNARPGHRASTPQQPRHRQPPEDSSDSSDNSATKPTHSRRAGRKPVSSSGNTRTQSVQTSPAPPVEIGKGQTIITYTPSTVVGEIGDINEQNHLPSDTEPLDAASPPPSDNDDDTPVTPDSDSGEQQPSEGESDARGEETETAADPNAGDQEGDETYSRRVCIGRGQSRWGTLTLLESFYFSLSTALKCLELGCPFRYILRIKQAAQKCQTEIETLLGRAPCLQNSEERVDDEDFLKIRTFYKLGLMLWTEKRKPLLCSPRTPNSDWPKIHFLLYNDGGGKKICLIRNYSEYIQSFECPSCHRRFTRRYAVDLHLQNSCEFVRWRELNPTLPENQFWLENEEMVHDLQYWPGKFRSPVPLLEAMSQIGVTVSSDFLPLNPWIGFFDIEAGLFPMEKETRVPMEMLQLTTFTKRQVPVCVAMSSNVTGYTKPVCFMSFSEYSDFLKNFVQYSYEVAHKSYALNRKRLEPILEQFDGIEETAGANGNIPFQKRVRSVLKRFIQHISRLTMLSYNGSRFVQLHSYCSQLSIVFKYDLPTLLRYSGLAYYLWEMDKKPPKATKRAANTFVSLSSHKLVFKDICNYFSGACSLRDFLREMNCEVGKMHFSYSSISSYESLHRTQPPAYEEFFSDLKNANTLELDYEQYQMLLADGKTEQEAMSEMHLTTPPLTGQQEYQKVLDLWRQKGFTAMFQWLAVYCIFDTISAVDASLKLRDYFFRVTQLDAFQFSTINSLAFTHLSRQLEESPDPYACFFARLDASAAEIVNAAKLGGICNSYDRIAVAGLTRIKPHQYGPEAEICDKIVGLDLVAMYPSSIKLFLTNMAGFYSLRTHENDFDATYVMGRSHKALSMLAWYAADMERSARSILSPEGEKALYVGRPGTSKCRVFLDGWFQDKDDVTGTAFSFHDNSIWHGYVDGAAEDDVNPVNGRTYAELRAETEEQDALISAHPLVTRHIIVKESQYDEWCRTDPEFNFFCRNKINGFSPPTIKNKMSQSNVKEALLSGQIVGLVEVDMSIKTREDYIKFSNFPPFVKKAKLASSDVLNPEIRAELEANKKLSRPQEMLISTMDGTQVTIPSQLLQYYVHELDLRLDFVWKVLQFRQSKCFESWYSNLIEMRAKAREEGSASLARTIKSVMNSSYVEQRTSTIFVKEERLEPYLERSTLQTLFNAGPPANCEGIYEVVLRQIRPKVNLPRQVAVEILGTSKILNLRFVYKFLWKYFRPSSWSLVFSDTDSFGLQVSCGGDWLKMKRPEFTDAEIEAAVLEFIVPTDGSELAKRLATEAGYIKEEKTGTVAIALAPKTYYVCNDVTGAHSIACKGIPKTKENEEIFNYLAFHNCLFGSLNSSAKATVRGIRTAPNDTLGPMSFVQLKNGLSNVSVKFEYCHCRTHFMIREVVADPTLRKLVYPYFEQCDTDPEQILNTVMGKLTDRNRRALEGNTN